MVVSFDGVNKDSIQFCKEGKISCIAECNPHHGPRVGALIEALEAGEDPEKFNYVDERMFSAVKTVTSVTVDGNLYKIEEPE